MWWLRFIFFFPVFYGFGVFFFPSGINCHLCSCPALHHSLHSLFGEGNCQYFRTQNYSTKCYALTLAPRVRNLMACNPSTWSGVARYSSWSVMNCDPWLLRGITLFCLSTHELKAVQKLRAASPCLGLQHSTIEFCFRGTWSLWPLLLCCPSAAYVTST